MTKCPICKTGNLTESGLHAYCDKCHAVQFIINDDYIEECCKLLGMLVSNTRFNSYQDFEDISATLIAQHTPMLNAWLATVTIGIFPLMSNIRNAIRAHAINLEIVDTAPIQEMEPDQTLSMDLHNVVQMRRREPDVNK